jgi:hypothetical protein
LADDVAIVAAGGAEGILYRAMFMVGQGLEVASGLIRAWFLAGTGAVPGYMRPCRGAAFPPYR